MHIILNLFLSSIITLACNQSSLEAPPIRDLPDHNVSQVMRSNAKHFWHWIMDRLDAQGDPTHLFSHDGTVFGDAHVSNFSVIPIEGKQRFVYFDFDDGGTAPFFADFARFITITKSTKRNIKIKALMDAHIRGLNGILLKTPEKLEKALNTSMAMYFKERREYIEKKHIDDKLIIGRDELSIVDSKEIQTVAKAFEAAMPAGYKVVDVVRFDKPRGGSAQSMRYWVLVKTENPELPYDLFEVKELIKPATAAHQPQDSELSRLALQKNSFWPQSADPTYNQVTIDGKPYEIRPKKMNLYEVSDKDFEEFAIFTANYMGYIYSKQQASRPYAVNLSANEGQARKLLKQIAREYRKIAKDHLDDQPND